MTTTPNNRRRQPRVFVSYDTQTDLARSFVHWLAARLCDDGIDAHAALFVPNPDEGWPMWHERQVRDASFVLAICDGTYSRHFDDFELHGGETITIEAKLLRQRCAEESRFGARILAVLPPGASKEDVPQFLRSSPVLSMRDEREAEVEYTNLYRILTDQPGPQRPPVGRRRSLPASPRPSFPSTKLHRLSRAAPSPDSPTRATQHELEAILRRPPRDWTDLLEADYEAEDEDEDETIDLPTRLAATLDELEGDPASTRRLIEVCEETLAWFEDDRADELHLAVDNIRTLLAVWLPRRQLSWAKIRPWDLGRPDDADACDDLVLETNNALFTEVHVARADDLPVDLEVKEDGRIEGRRCLPIPAAQGSRRQSDHAAAEEMADGLASQFPGTGQHDGTLAGHRRFVRGHFAQLRRRRRRRKPRYMAFRPDDIPATVLTHFKRIYPPLRLVLLTGQIDDDEQEILHALLDIFSDDDEPPN